MTLDSSMMSFEFEIRLNENIKEKARVIDITYIR